MRRREFVRLIGAAAIAPASAAVAQLNGTSRRIGILLPASSSDSKVKNDLAAFARRLQSLGWSEGQNLQIDYRWAGDDIAEMQSYAKELVAAKPDVLFARGTPATAALLRNTRTIPVVSAVVSDPVGEGFVTSVARPGGNATGFTNAESSLTGKWLGLLKEVTSNLTRIGFVFDPKVAPGGGSYYTSLLKTAAASSALALTPMPFHEGRWSNA